MFNKHKKEVTPSEVKEMQWNAAGRSFLFNNMYQELNSFLISSVDEGNWYLHWKTWNLAQRYLQL